MVVFFGNSKITGIFWGQSDEFLELFWLFFLSQWLVFFESIFWMVILANYWGTFSCQTDCIGVYLRVLSVVYSCLFFHTLAYSCIFLRLVAVAWTNPSPSFIIANLFILKHLANWEPDMAIQHSVTLSHNGQLRIANATSGGARKLPGPKYL